MKRLGKDTKLQVSQNCSPLRQLCNYRRQELDTGYAVFAGTIWKYQSCENHDWSYGNNLHLLADAAIDVP